MKILNSKLISLLLFFIIVAGLENCRFYKKREVSESLKIQDYLGTKISGITPNYELVKDSLGKNYKSIKLSTKYNYFVYYKGNIIRITNVRIDSALNKIVFSSSTNRPDRLQSNYYEKIETGQYKLRKRHRIDKKAIMQVHFLLNSRNVNENTFFGSKMFYTKDITKIEVLNSAHGLNFITNIIIVPVEAFLGILTIAFIGYSLGL